MVEQCELHLVLRNFKRSEILDFLKRDFPDYSWSLASLSRRIEYFDIKYTDYSTTVEQVRAAFQEENSGPSQLLGYHAMHKQIREKHGLAVPRGLVYDVMMLDDEDGLMAYGDDYLEPNVRANCERIIPEVETVLPNDAADSFLFLKAHYRHQRQ